MNTPHKHKINKIRLFIYNPIHLYRRLSLSSILEYLKISFKYHFIISRNNSEMRIMDGSIRHGLKMYNRKPKDSVLDVCIIGQRSGGTIPFTTAQINTTFQLCSELMSYYNLKIFDILGNYEYYKLLSKEVKDWGPDMDMKKFRGMLKLYKDGIRFTDSEIIDMLMCTAYKSEN